MLYCRYCHISAFFFANPLTSERFHEICLNDIFQWVWMKLLSSFLLQAKQILNLGYFRATQVTWTGTSSQGLAVEVECVYLEARKQELSFCHLVFQMIWSLKMPLWDGLTDGKLGATFCPCSCHLQKFR